MGNDWVMIGIIALAASLAYAGFVHLVYRRDPTNPYTATWVVGGVLLTLLIGALLVPLESILVLTGIFVLTGTPQIVGSMIREVQRRRQAERQFTDLLKAQARKDE